MDKIIWKSTGAWSYFLGNVLVGVRIAFLPDYSLVLFLLKHRGVGAFLKKKKRIPSRGNLLNSSIDKRITIVFCSTKTYHLFQSTKIKKIFWDTWPRMHEHFIWGVIAMLYAYRNIVKFAVSCYKFSKIARVVKSYPYPYLCPCIWHKISPQLKSNLRTNWIFSEFWL